MSLSNSILGLASTIFVIGCAKGGNANGDGGGGGDGGAGADASCGTMCDQDHDGVVDGSDKCPNTASGAKVNMVGCADSQLTPMLEPIFPPYGLTWTPTGELGRAGGLTWIYVGIQRKDLFHIYWIVCDDPATPCGLSLDGPIDMPAESWTFSAADSDLANGKLVYTNTTRILLADNSTPTLNGRLTLTIVDAGDIAIHFAPVASLGVTARLGTYGAEIVGGSFKVVALAEVQVPATTTWTPYQDYYDAAPTPTAGGGAQVSLDGAFYDK